MGWAWTHLRRLWAAIGTVTASLIVTWIYSLLSEQPLPHIQTASRLLRSYWPALGAVLLILTLASTLAERAHRLHDSRAPRPLRMKPRGWRRPLGRKSAPSIAAVSGTSIVVGREAELVRLQGWLAQVKTDRRRVVFVAGEPGIGKSTIVNAFLASLARDRTISVGRGHCVEQYGAGEPYMPILEALTRMCREPDGERLLAILHRLAPAWLAQMPSLVSAEDRLRLQGQSQGATQQRMLREMAEALEAITAESPLVLLLEDLHWSDYSTLDLIAAIARRTEPAQLMILGTYRPVEMLAGEHPLRAMKAELELHHQCEELRLKLLSEIDVAAYLQQRFANDVDFGVPQSGAQLADSTSPLTPLLNGEGNRSKRFGILRGVYPERSRRTQNDKSGFTSENNAVSFRSEQALRAAEGSAERGIPDSTTLAPAVYARSEGNPLFMVNVVDFMIAQGPDFGASKLEAPHNLRQMIERNLERLTPDEQSMLEAASVAGAEFSAATVAAALERPIPEIEACCTKLARREQFVGAKEPIAWPDGTIATGFRFHHALYQETLYGRLPAAHRVELHRRIAQREEAGFGDRAGEIAAELASHYDHCDDQSKTFKYSVLAGERAVARRAYREAEDYYRNAITALCALPESADRDKQELQVQIALGNLTEATRGWSARETADIYRRASVLVDRSGVESLEVTHGEFSAAITRGDLRLASAIAGKMLQIVRGGGSLAAISSAHYAQGLAHYFLGELNDAGDHLSQAIEHYREEDFHGANSDPGIGSRIFSGSVEWQLGYPDRALRAVDEAISFARRWKPSLSLAFALSAGSYVYGACGDLERVLEVTGEAMHLSDSLGFPLQHAIAEIRSGWALVKTGGSEGLGHILQGLSQFDQLHFHLARGSFLIYLVEAQLLMGNLEAASQTVDQALYLSHRELIFRPELLRLLGELQWKKLNDHESIMAPENYFREAIKLAQCMGAKSWGLRATTSLARLLASQGNRDEARMMLAAIYNWFTEGFDTADLKDAKALLNRLDSES